MRPHNWEYSTTSYNNTAYTLRAYAFALWDMLKTLYEMPAKRNWNYVLEQGI